MCIANYNICDGKFKTIWKNVLVSGCIISIKKEYVDHYDINNFGSNTLKTLKKIIYIVKNLFD